jgi:hypothetical protein
MTTAHRIAFSLAGAALTGAGVYYLGGSRLAAAAGGATAVFLVLFLRLKQAA